MRLRRHTVYRDRSGEPLVVTYGLRRGPQYGAAPGYLFTRQRGALDFVRDQRGVALVMAIGLMAVMAIVATSALHFTAAGQNHANRSYHHERAYAAAEAGINEAAAVAANATDREDFAGAYWLDGARVTYYGSPIVLGEDYCYTDCWELDAVGQYRGQRVEQRALSNGNGLVPGSWRG